MLYYIYVTYKLIYNLYIYYNIGYKPITILCIAFKEWLFNITKPNKNTYNL